MIRYDFPDLQWLKQQIAHGFVERRGPSGEPLKTDGWPSIILQVKAKDIYRNNIKGPFSLFGNLSGYSTVKVENRQVKLDSSCFLVTNAQQEYTLEIDRQPAETFNIHFGDTFAADILTSYQYTSNHLLDQPIKLPVTFYNHLISKTEEVQQLILQLQFNQDALRKEELLAELFLCLLRDQIALQQKENDLPSIKKATRQEILKRLLLSIDYIQSNFGQEIELTDLASISCLSKFHFLRLFKIAFQQSPYQYLTTVRLTRARALLKANPTIPIHHLSKRMGFQDSSTFSRSFFRHTGFYPSQYRE